MKILLGIFICLFLLSTTSFNVLALNQTKIMLYGDSLMAGYGLSQNENLSSALSSIFNVGDSKVQIINASVSGNTSSNGLARLDWSLEDKPNIVILCLGANDMLRGIDPKLTKQNLNKIIEKMLKNGSKVILAGMRSPENMGQNYQQKFDLIYQELAEEHDVIFMPFLLDGIALEKDYLQSDFKHPNALGVNIMSSNLYPYILQGISSL